MDNRDFGKRRELLVVCVDGKKPVLEQEKLPPAYDLSEPWVQEYIRQYGREPSFFDV
jgi:hypothetical protein